MTAPSWLEINLSRLDANLDSIRQILSQNQSQPSQICAVVKADAYGLGITQIARRLVDRGVQMLAVYSLDQARLLVQAGISANIMLLMPVREMSRSDALYRVAVSGRLQLTIHGPEHLAEVNLLGQTLGCRLPVHLFMDTGMSRSGMSGEQTKSALTKLSSMRGVQLAGICTHLATADSDAAFADEQLERLDSLLEQYSHQIDPSICIHVANTYATLRSSRFHRSMVRVGLGLFGYGDSLIDVPDTGNHPPLQPIVRWLSRIVHLQWFKKGESVGYGRTHRLTRDSLLGVIPVGYGDGYPAALGNRASVEIRHPGIDAPIVAPVVGRVSMDQIVVDVTHDEQHAAVDSSVTLISDDPSSACVLPNLAELADSNCYELLCRLSPRLPRLYKHTESQPVLTSSIPRPHKMRMVPSAG